MIISRRRQKTGKLIRNSILVIVILIILAVGAGVGYTYYLGTLAPASAFKTLDDVAPKKAVKSQKPAVDTANVPTSASITSFMTSVSPGNNATISIQTNPGAVCAITVIYNNVPSKDSGLQSKTADEYGTLTWSWTVEDTVSLGQWPITITCTHNKKDAVVTSTVDVTKTPDSDTGA